MYHIIFCIFLCLAGINSLHAQVVTSTPTLPIAEDSISIIFYSDRGSGGLKGFTGDVYAHTGVITSESTGPSNWRYVKTNWGQNTSETRLTRFAPDKWRLTIPNIRSYYGVPSQEQILKIALVFRSAFADKEGKDTGNKDIFIDLYQIGAIPTFKNPLSQSVLLEVGEQLSLSAFVSLNNTALKNFSLLINEKVYVDAGIKTTIDTVFTPANSGTFILQLKTIDTANQIKTSSISVIVVPASKQVPLPSGISEGLTITSDTTAVFCLFAPYHKSVYLIGDFNSYTMMLPEYQMNRAYIDKDNVYYWLEVSGLKQGLEYGYQFVVDGSIRVADPFAHKFLHETLDNEIINQNRYPNLKPYPKGQTSEFVSVFTMRPKTQTEIYPFEWKHNYTRIPQKDLVIYELLIRDFTEKRSYKAIIDSLDYLKKLGINAIQLMPIMEFDGNLSWGYDPAFHFGADKYYGTEYELKQLIDESHKRGIAVILDIVLNHLTGASPLIRMWADGKYGPPSSINPYANVFAPHPYSVFNDLNHESKALQRYIDRVNKYWLTEFKADGYRFDLSKGFTQLDSKGNYGTWAAYDAVRVKLLHRMRNTIRQYDSSAFLILEHFADTKEERELTDSTFMVWHNMNPTYIEASMGYINGQSDQGTASVYYKNRSLNQPGNIAYLESHDEERLVKKHYCYGKSIAGYTTKDTTIALQRSAAIASLFFPIPGPRMIWQFGELGYDEGLQLTGSCTDNASIRMNFKPLHWDYLKDIRRNRLQQIYSALINLREQKVFSSLDSKLTFKASKGDTIRWISYQHQTMNALIIANLDMVQRTVKPPFPSTGTYYDYFTGTPLQINSNGNVLSLKPGEFHVFTTVQLPKPPVESWSVTGLDNQEEIPKQGIYPHPAIAHQHFTCFTSLSNGIAKVYDIHGSEISSSTIDNEGYAHMMPLQSGLYSILCISSDGTKQSRQSMIVQ